MFRLSIIIKIQSKSQKLYFILNRMLNRLLLLMLVLEFLSNSSEIWKFQLDNRAYDRTLVSDLNNEGMHVICNGLEKAR